MTTKDSPDFFVRLENHIAENTAHRQKVLDQLASGDWRMTLLEGHVKEIKQTLTPVDAFVKSLKLIVWLAGAVLALFLWIMLGKNAEIQAMQQTLVTHSTQISETIALMRESMRDHDKDVQRIERAMEARK